MLTEDANTKDTCRLILLQRESQTVVRTLASFGECFHDFKRALFAALADKSKIAGKK